MKLLVRWGKLGFSLLMLLVVLYVSNPGHLLPALLQADAELLLVGVGLWGLIQALNVYKWYLLNRAQGLHVSYRQLFNIYFIGMFFNTFLPSGFGGDAVRAYQLARLTRQGGTSTASVILDRMTSLYALLLLATVALSFAPKALQVIPVSWMLGLDLLGALAFYVLLQPSWLMHVLRFPWVARSEKIRAFIEEVASSTLSLGAATRIFLITLGISLVFQFLGAVEHHFFLRALGITTPFASTALFFPILTIVSSLPISVNGLGLREGGWVYFLGTLGVAREDAVLVGLISFSMLLLSGIWGAFVYMGARRKPQKPLMGPEG